MFLGHFAAGLALKRVAPQVSLGTLFLGTQFIDLLWPTLLLTGTEHVVIDPEMSGPPLRFTDYPVSHSLLAVVGWAALVGAAHFTLRRSGRAAAVIAIAVLSHWFLDLVVHHPDLPLAPGTDIRLGFGLWQFTSIALVLELGLFALGAWMYLRITAPVNRIGSIGLWCLFGFLLLIHLGNVFGPPPPSVTAIAWTGQAQWLLVLWGYWVDRHRRPR
jgi:hypothetical protein